MYAYEVHYKKKSFKKIVLLWIVYNKHEIPRSKIQNLYKSL